MEIIGYTLFREARSRAPLARYNCDTDAIQDTLSLSGKPRYATFPRKFTRSTSAHARASAKLPCSRGSPIRAARCGKSLRKTNAVVKNGERGTLHARARANRTGNSKKWNSSAAENRRDSSLPLPRGPFFPLNFHPIWRNRALITPYL